MPWTIFISAFVSIFAIVLIAQVASNIFENKEEE